MNKLFVIITIWLSPAATLFSQQPISVEDFTTRETFTEKTVTGINWMNDGKFYSTLSENTIIRYDVITGAEVQTLVDGSTLPNPITIDDYSFSEDEQKILLLSEKVGIYRHSFLADYYVYDVKTRTQTQLSPNGKQSYATFSPDGSKVAFVRNNNLFYVALSDMQEHQVTNDGKFNSIINGTTDWVYEEEFSFVVGFAWSPDSQKLAYYRFDESQVKEYNLQLWAESLYPVDYRYKYPKAGEKNSSVEIWFFDLPSGKKSKARLGDQIDVYIPAIKWTTDSNVLAIRKLNRLQNELTLLHTNATSGESDIVIEEKTSTYFDIEVLDINYLSNGKEFIYSSEADGYKHLYLYNTHGVLIRQLTKGDFDVSQFLGLDQKSKTLYYVSTEISPLERHFYSLSIDGKRKTRLSASAGNHDINMSRDFQFYFDHHSSAAHPEVVTLYKTKNNQRQAVLEKNEKLETDVVSYAIVPKQFFTFAIEDGTLLNGYMLKPADFDSTRNYPLVMYQYSGPASQEVLNSWAGDHYYFHQLLVQKGYIVAIVDPRGTGGRGERFKKITYKQLGKFELEDHLAAAKFLAGLEYIDETRMAIWGWSYGGYMSSLVLTKGGGIFKAGIAVSPVTNWRFYDTIYTERFLQTPQLNPGGYDENSPLTYASELKGKFLLIHGTGDDNVHFQNSIIFEDALIRAGKQFQSFYYPDKHHALEGADTQFHLYTMMLEFIQRNL